MRGAGVVTMGASPCRFDRRTDPAARRHAADHCLHDYGAEYVEVGSQGGSASPLVDEQRGMRRLAGYRDDGAGGFGILGTELRAQGLPPRIGLLLGAGFYEDGGRFFRVEARLKVRAVFWLRDTKDWAVSSARFASVMSCCARAGQGVGAERDRRTSRSGAYGSMGACHGIQSRHRRGYRTPPGARWRQPGA